MHIIMTNPGTLTVLERQCIIQGIGVNNLSKTLSITLSIKTVFSICCLVPAVFEKEDPYVRQKPSYALKIEAHKQRLPMNVPWVTRIIKTFDGMKNSSLVSLILKEG